ncbi:MAG: TonB-dependent receptor [Burkholderiaceae bacterium]|nr:TonB-dependent receptor [Burkholderiaceae bacterium]
MQTRAIALAVITTLASTTATGLAHAAGAEPNQRSLSDLSLEELMNIEVTSVAKKPQRVADTASAVFVITGEDIRRSGVTSIAEALRMAPGLEVARFGSNKWAVSIRGFNGRFANKLLVLMDGRTVYTPLFSGVLWETQDAVLEDIERIEVIRGPGAALWGANAVNGIINIITRKASDTHGTLVSAGAGDSERSFATIRHGGTVGTDGAYRIYAKGFSRDSYPDLTGRDGPDDWTGGLVGFRLDRALAAGEDLSVQVNAFQGRIGEQFTTALLDFPYRNVQDIKQRGEGANVLLRWQGRSAAGSSSALQAYLDHTRFELGAFSESRDTLDLDYQRRLPVGASNDLIVGAAYRLSHDSITPTDTVTFAQTSLESRLFSAFAQDEITLAPDLLRLTLGSRFEHNSYTGSEIQPNARLLWTPAPEHSFWGSVSRAVRTPARFEAYGRIRQAVIPPSTPGNPGPLPVELAIVGNTEFDSEKLVAYELGYRTQLAAHASVDWTVFSNHYDGIRGFVLGAPQPVPVMAIPTHVVQPLNIANSLNGHVNGTEVAVEMRPREWWRLQGHAGVQWLSFTDINGPEDSITGAAPRHTFSVRSMMNLRSNIELDLWLRHVDALHGLDVPAYTTLDLRLGWKPRRDIELSLVGQNLSQPRHQEFVSDFIGTTTNQVPRSVYVRLDWRF